MSHLTLLVRHLHSYSCIACQAMYQGKETKTC